MPGIPERLRSALLVGSTLVALAKSDAQQLAGAAQAAQATRASQGAPAVATGVVAGRVIRALDSIPLAHALVSVEGTDLTTRTDPAGAFRITGVPVKARAVLVTRIGYHPSEVPAVPGTTVSHGEVVKMYGLPGWLHAVEILGEKRDVPPSLRDIYKRAKMGWGNFFTIEDIEREQPYDVKSLLNAIPGTAWNDRGIYFSRCPDFLGGQLQVYIDGTLIHPGKSFGPIEILKLVPISQIQAVEVYNGTAEIPAEYLENACAVISVWTKRD